MRAWQAEKARRAAEVEGTSEQRHRGAEGEGHLGVGEGIQVAAMPDAGGGAKREEPLWKGSPTSLWGLKWGWLPTPPPPLSREGTAAWGWPERQPGFRCEKKATPAPFMRQPGGGGGEEGGTQSTPQNDLPSLPCRSPHT